MAVAMTSISLPKTLPPLHSYNVHSDAVNGISIGFKDMLSVSSDCSIAVTNLETTSVVRKITTGSAARCIYRDIKDESNQTCFWTGHFDGSLSLFDLRIGDDSPVTYFYKKHLNCVSAISIHESGNQLATASHDNSIRIWDLRKSACRTKLFLHNDRVTDLKFHKSLTVSSGLDGFVVLRDDDSGNIRRLRHRAVGFLSGEKAPGPPARLEPIHSVHVQGNEKESAFSIYAGYSSGRIRRFKMSSTSLPSGSSENTEEEMCFIGRQGYAVTSISCSADGTCMFSGSDDGTILGWGSSAPAGLTKIASEPLVLMKGHKDGILKTQWSRGILYTASYDGSVKLWDSYEVSRIINPGFTGKAVCLHIDEFGASSGSDIPIEELPSQIQAAKFNKARCFSLSRNKAIVADFGIRVKISGWSQKPGIIIDDLVIGGPAHECGLRPRDSIVTIENVQAASVSAVEFVLDNMKHGSKSCFIQTVKHVESGRSHGSVESETPQMVHDHDLKFGISMQPQFDTSLSWLHVLSYCPVAISAVGSITDQVNAIIEIFSGIPDVFSALFARFGIKWKKQQTSGILSTPYLTSFELCEFLIASNLAKPHCGLVQLSELFSENILEAKGNRQQSVPFWHTKYMHYATFIMIGMLRLACVKYSKKLTSIPSRLSHLIEKHVKPSFVRPEEVLSSSLSHQAIVSQEDRYGDLSMFLSNSEKQLLGRDASQSDPLRIDDMTRGSRTLRFAIDDSFFIIIIIFSQTPKRFSRAFLGKCRNFRAPFLLEPGSSRTKRIMAHSLCDGCIHFFAEKNTHKFGQIYVHAS
jgi:WD40 repeat protein